MSRGSAAGPYLDGAEHATVRASPVDRPSWSGILECLPIITWACHGDGACYFLSQRWADYTGIACDVQLGWQWMECIHPDDREASFAHAQRAVEQNEDFRTQYRVRRHDGVYRWFAAHGRCVRDAQGKVVQWFGCTTDIHEEHETQIALSHEHQLLERIIATAPGTFFMLRRSKDGIYSHPAASPAVQKLLGASDQQLAQDANAALDRVHPEDRARVRADIEESARSLTPWTTEHRFVHSEEGELWIEPHALPQLEPDGSVIWYGFVRDVTQRKQAEAALRATQAQLMSALEAGGMGILTWDIDSDRLWLDDAFLKLLGRSRREVTALDQGLFDFVHADDLTLVQARLEDLRLHRCKDHRFEYRVVRSDGQVRALSAVAHRSYDDANGRPQATVLHVDVTEQKRVADSQLRSQKLEALGTLAGGIAHDFNNMLHAIAGNTTLALRIMPSDHPARGFLDAVSVAGARASDLVRRILAFSRPVDPVNEVLSLQAAVGEALALVRATVPTSIELRIELGDDPLFIDAEPTQIHQLVLNLASNAAHAIGPTTGLVQVQLERASEEPAALPAELAPGQYAVLQVSDSGCGMSAATIERIFDPFFTTKPVGEGTGLGLSVVHGIMKSLNGAATVASKLGHGTTFALYFPLAKRRATSSSRPPRRLGAARGGRVLIVDDEHILVQLGVHMLEALGYEAVGRQCPRQALRELLADPCSFDALITDITMPELSGFDLAARVRERYPDFPIIVMSGNVGPNELATAERLRLQKVLLKPVEFEALDRALAKVLGAARTKATQEEPLAGARRPGPMTATPLPKSAR